MKTNQQNYFDVYYQPGETPVFCYRSGMIVYEERLYRGTLCTCGYNAAGFPLNVLLDWPIRMSHKDFREPFVFNLEINGQSIDYNLTFVDFTYEKNADHLHAVLTLDSGIMPVRLQVHTILDGTQMFCRYITLKNLTDQQLAVSRMCVLSGGVEAMDMMHRNCELAPEKYYELGYFDNDQWGREGQFSWHPLMPGCTDVDFRFYRERYRHPLVFLRNNIEGTIYFSQIAWSGGCRYSVDLNAVKEAPDKNFSCPKLSMKAEILGYNPLITLAPDEEFTTPEVHMGVVLGDLDAAVNEMHAHIRKSVLSAPETDASACLVGSGIGAEHHMSVAATKAYIDQLSQMGAETFTVDAGWQTAPDAEQTWHAVNGMNQPHHDRYPNGIREIRDYCHSKSMKFCMWVEIERLGKDCDVMKQHPEWLMTNIFGERQDVLDFTNNEAAKWAEDELARMIEAFGLDMLRVDYNTSSGEYVTARHILAVYAMYSRLKTRYPDVIFENCASGGGRTDLGMMKSFNHTWVSDWQRMPHSSRITSGMTMALPPEKVDRLCFGMSSHCYGSFDANMRNTMLTHMTLNVVAPFGTEPNPQQMAFAQHSVEIYKNFIRPILPECKVYHHTPETTGETILEVASYDGTKGAITAFAHGNNVITVYPRGVDVSRNYRVTLDNNQQCIAISGYDLQTWGLCLNIPAAMSSELVLFEAV